MHTVLKLWTLAEKRGSMLPREALTLVAGEGVPGDHARRTRRPVTIVFADDWAAACADLGREVPPETRRASVYVTGGPANRYLGRRIRLGEALIEIRGAVDPCYRMDEAADGLTAALTPGDRGGIWGVVVEGGTVRLGDGLAEIVS